MRLMLPIVVALKLWIWRGDKSGEVKGDAGNALMQNALDRLGDRSNGETSYVRKYEKDDMCDRAVLEEAGRSGLGRS
jgi:hypothetical protein